MIYPTTVLLSKEYIDHCCKRTFVRSFQIFILFVRSFDRPKLVQYKEVSKIYEKNPIETIWRFFMTFYSLFILICILFILFLDVRTCSNDRINYERTKWKISNEQTKYIIFFDIFCTFTGNDVDTIYKNIECILCNI